MSMRSSLARNIYTVRVAVTTVVVFFLWAFIHQLYYGLTSYQFAAVDLLARYRLLLILGLVVLAIIALYKKEHVLQVLLGLVIGFALIILLGVLLQFWPLSIVGSFL